MRPTRRGDDERGSMLIVLAFILFSSLILAVVVQTAFFQLGVGTTLVKRDNALQAATAGAQAVLAEIRGATTTADGTDGVVSELPCGTTSGTTPASGGSGTYSATVVYDLVSTTGGAGETTSCLSGGLPSGYNLSTATITSTGTADAAVRDLRSTYHFQTTFTPIPGGKVMSYDGNDCLYADIPSTNTGSGPYELEATTNCPSPPPAQESFVYNANWTLEVVVGGTAFCVQNPYQSGNSSGGSEAALLEPCSTVTGAAPNYQEWGINDSAPLQGVASGGTAGNTCLTNPIASGTTSSPPLEVTVQGCTGSFSQAQTWQPEASVGAGDAAPTSGQFFGPTDQLVNFQQFGRCLDVNGQSIYNNDLIVYPCKQFPDPAAQPIWNQRWCWEPLPQASTADTDASVGILYTPNPTNGSYNNSAQPCAPSSFTSASTDQWPGSGSTTVVPECVVPEGVSENTGGYFSEPFVEPCNISDWPPTSAADLSALEAKDMVWVQSGASAPSNLTYTYSAYPGNDAGYANADDSGECLTAGALGTASGGDQYSFANMDPCNGAWTEKWNTPPSFAIQPVSDTYEPVLAAP
ncbi:MAG: hypothetical protein M0T80_00760 [Actinomycetota bacterium]|nr:hypothetical protein [Actinomycetota bacterium]